MPNYPYELMYPDHDMPGAVRLKVAAMCACLDAQTIDGIELTDADVAPYLQPSKSHVEGIESVWVRSHAFVNIEPTGNMAKAVDKVLAALVASIRSGEIKPLVRRARLNGELDMKETWISAGEFQLWCEQRSLNLEDCWQQYWDDESKVHEVAATAGEQKRMGLETIAFEEQLRMRTGKLEGLPPHLLDEFMGILKENISLRGGSGSAVVSERPLTVKERDGLLTIVGALLDLMLAPVGNGQTRSAYLNQAAIIEAILAHHEKRSGLSKRNLESKFAEAKEMLTRG